MRRAIAEEKMTWVVKKDIDSGRLKVFYSDRYWQ